jgi:hypothetical protein
MFLSLTVYFFTVQPKNDKRFPFILSTAMLFIAVILTLYQRVIISHDFGTVWVHAIVIWGITFALPYAAGFVYRFITRNLPAPNRNFFSL